MKTLEFTAIEPISEKGKEKLKKLFENQKERIEKAKQEFKNGVYDDVINELKNTKK